MINVKLKDGSGQSYRARVTKYNQVVTGPVAYNEIKTIKLDVDDQVYNFISPRSGHKIVIDGILLYANKNVGAGDSTVTIYESAEGPASATQTKIIMQTEMLKKTSRDVVGLNYLTAEGVWINASTDDDDAFLTILYYYVPITDIT